MSGLPRLLGWTAVALALASLAGDCGGGNGGGSTPVVEIDSPDPRCVALPDPLGFPPGYDFFPERQGRVLATTFSNSALVPLDVRQEPFVVPDGAEVTELPADADGDGCDEIFPPLIDDVTALGRSLAGVTTSAYETVLFANARGGLAEVELAMPAAPVDPDFDRSAEVDPREFLLWPEAGTSARRTGLPNFTCIVPRDGAVDSRGDPIDPVAPQGDPCTPALVRSCPQDRSSYYANFTSGVTVAAGRLFVAVSNLGADRGETDTQYFPAALTVYAWDDSASPPRATPIATPDGGAFLLGSEGAYNYTHVQTVESEGGRTWVVATATGAIGIVEDDPDTEDFEAGAVRLGDGVVDVFDPEALQLVARYPLRDANPAFSGLAVDPSGRAAAVGDVTAKQVYVLDLTALDALPDPPVPGAAPVRLAHAVLFDGRDPLEVPSVRAGAPEASCPGRIETLAWNDAGDRLYALEVCDGSLTGFGFLSSEGAPRREDFVLGRTVAVTAPLRADTLGLPRQPSRLRVRPGRPGVDFSGPDLFFLVSEPEALLCGIDVESE
ncbi:MAG: hypothetical protein ACQGVK_06725 [Myxococcota bacterium]